MVQVRSEEEADLPNPDRLLLLRPKRVTPASGTGAQLPYPIPSRDQASQWAPVARGSDWKPASLPLLHLRPHRGQAVVVRHAQQVAVCPRGSCRCGRPRSAQLTGKGPRAAPRRIAVLILYVPPQWVGAYVPRTMLPGGSSIGHQRFPAFPVLQIADADLTRAPPNLNPFPSTHPCLRSLHSRTHS